MESDHLQHIVDALAEKLHRSVSIDDPSMRLLAASKHFGDEDPARVRSILDRYAGDEETKFVLSRGIASWTQPGRVPAHPPNLCSRFCIPLRCHGLRLGYLWLIDAYSTLTGGEIGQAAGTAEHLALLLYRRLVLHEQEQARTGGLLRDLLSADPAARAHAVREISDDELVSASDHVAVLSAEAFGMADETSREQAAVALGVAVERAARTMPPRSVLAFAQGSRALMLLARAAPPADDLTDEMAATAVREFNHRKSPSDRLLIGIGSIRRGLAGAAESHRQAATASRAARLLPRLGPVARWDRLGPYALLLQLPPEQLSADDWNPALNAIRDADPDGALTRTLEVFLDSAGDVQRTARQLRVHRTTLYHRLQRIEQAASVDLRDGTDRLTLHLGLKLAKLARATSPEDGRWPSQHPAEVRHL